MFRSLTSRFIFASTLILPIFLGLSVFGLNSAFQESLLSGEEEKLKSHIYLLLGAADVSKKSLWMPEQFQEPRLNQIESGLYGIIYDAQLNELWRSPSAKLLSKKMAASRTENTTISPGAAQFSTISINNEDLFSYSQDILWELEKGNGRSLRFSIYHSQDEFKAESKTYQSQSWKWLGIFGLCILLAQVIILRWGLNPLKNLATDLKKIESGDHSKLTGNYPTEIQPVTDNLNHVIDVEKKQRERYRTTLDDLAHSLKTPLSVIQSIIENNSSHDHPNDKTMSITLSTIKEQTERMNQIVQHQLQRAVLGQSKSIGNKINILSITERITDALKKVYADKDLSVSISIDSEQFFWGDERDVFELLGNLIENAFKYSNKKIFLTSIDNTDAIIISIDDDGKGIPEERRERILDRGARIDTITQGQGIGLTVALDIISSYNGSLDVGQSFLGGASFKITLPTSR